MRYCILFLCNTNINKKFVSIIFLTLKLSTPVLLTNTVLWSVVCSRHAGRWQPVQPQWGVRLPALCWGMWVLWRQQSLRRVTQLGHADRHPHHVLCVHLLPPRSRSIHLEVRKRQGKNQFIYRPSCFRGTLLLYIRNVFSSDCGPMSRIFVQCFIKVMVC